MKRPWQFAAAFVVVAAGLTAAMAWLTMHAVQADRERAAARSETEFEQQVSLALWRMDTELAPLLAAEAARPVERYVEGYAEEYLDSHLPEQVTEEGAGQGEFIRVRFELDQGSGTWIAPAEVLRSTRWRSPALQQLAWRDPPAEEQLAKQLTATVDPLALAMTAAEWPLVAASGEAPILVAQAPPPLPEPPAQGKLAAANTKAASQIQDFQNRALSSSKLQSLANQSASQASGSSLARVAISATRPFWSNGELVLARRAERDGQRVVQGAWIDWPALKERLLNHAVDIAPGADLRLLKPGETGDMGRLLAALPAELVAAPPEAHASVSRPLALALVTGWLALVAAIIAVAALLVGVLSLSERRAAFVSSVTHELRTPLTTFRMYAEMLANDMTTSPEQRREYLQTLVDESQRLTHLVENVLAYARLERGRRPQREAIFSATELVELARPRLAQRADEAGMRLSVELDPKAAQARLRTDLGAVEQVLFNLVDNVAKYAQGASDRRIHLSVTSGGRWVQFAVRDHGPGLPAGRRWRGAFHKSAQQAAESAPGVGLGLALCRRLARGLGGRLTAGPAESDGAEVTLSLPRNLGA